MNNIRQESAQNLPFEELFEQKLLKMKRNSPLKDGLHFMAFGVKAIAQVPPLAKRIGRILEMLCTEKEENPFVGLAERNHRATVNFGHLVQIFRAVSIQSFETDGRFCRILFFAARRSQGH